MNKEKKKMFTAKEFAKEVGVSYVTIYNWLRDGKIDGERNLKGFKVKYLICYSQLKKIPGYKSRE